VRINLRKDASNRIDSAIQGVIAIQPGTATSGPPLALNRTALAALDQVDDAVVLTCCDWRVTYMNAAARRVAGLAATDDGRRALARVLPVYDSADAAVFLLRPGELWRSRTSEPALTLRTPDGASRRVVVSVTPTEASADQAAGWSIVLRDRSRESGLEQRLIHQASHDALTDLPNRRAFEEHVGEALRVCAENSDIRCAVLYLDIDLFKIINDTCGHAAGDQFLCAAATALRERVRSSDVLARLGGDEFGVLLHGCTTARALDVARELRSIVKALECTWDGRRYQHTVSIGVAPIHGDEQTVATILSAADVACFAAKDRGRDCVTDYGHATVPERQAQMHWVSRVARACDDDRFVLYQQPIVPLQQASDPRPHYELLLRMVARDGKVIMPAAFIPAAERYNIMPRVDRWTVRKALSELVWRGDRALGAPYMLSINLSGTSLSDAKFRRFVIEQLDALPIAENTLCFEVTETAAIANIHQVADFMHQLHERKCRFSLDDFGTGLSSFAYLKDLPVDYLKVDGQFIRQLLNDKASAAVVRAFNDIGRSLGIRTVAERVEDLRTARALADIGVDYGQGYYFARPCKLLNRQAFIVPGPAVFSPRVAV
jgi:diguanylate cyclase (GGDEF)-like protein